MRKKLFFILSIITSISLCFAKEIDICGLKFGMSKELVQKTLENKGAWEGLCGPNGFQCDFTEPIYFEGAYVNWFYVSFDEYDCLNAVNVHFTMDDSVSTKDVQKCYASLWNKYSGKDYNISLNEIFDNVFITPENNIIAIFFRNSHFQILLTEDHYLAP